MGGWDGTGHRSLKIQVEFCVHTHFAIQVVPNKAVKTPPSGCKSKGEMGKVLSVNEVPLISIKKSLAKE